MDKRLEERILKLEKILNNRRIKNESSDIQALIEPDILAIEDIVNNVVIPNKEAFKNKAIAAEVGRAVDKLVAGINRLRDNASISVNNRQRDTLESRIKRLENILKLKSEAFDLDQECLNRLEQACLEIEKLLNGIERKVKTSGDEIDRILIEDGIRKLNVGLTMLFKVTSYYYED